MSQKIIPVIMAGGRGTRLWPLSRANTPKQFIQIMGQKTLFQRTLQRVQDECIYEAPVVITNQEFRFTVAEQAREIGATLSTIILEPVARNTAPAVAAVAFHLQQRFGDNAILLLLASDHELDAGDDWKQAISSANRAASAGKIVTFGIIPTEPATGYGYIEQGAVLPSGAFQITRFVEKPKREIAEDMISKGGYFWNSGIFMSRVDTLIDEFSQHSPETLEAARAAVKHAVADLDFLRLDESSFRKCPDISIDYAVMEKTTNSAVIPSTFSWSDLGSWEAVWKSGRKDSNENCVIGEATVVNTKNSLILSHSAHLAIQGMSDVAVIASEDAIYVGRLDEAQQVGALVKILASTKPTAGLTETHRTAYRPWGGFTSLFTGDRFQVKRLFVLPNKKLSLQKHHHRSEHWICVKGTAEVTIGDKILLVRENESVYIPQGELHRLYNPGMITLEMIEVQTGSYLCEDDIIRVSDEFGRK